MTVILVTIYKYNYKYILGIAIIIFFFHFFHFFSLMFFEAYLLFKIYEHNCYTFYLVDSNFFKFVEFKIK